MSPVAFPTVHLGHVVVGRSLPPVICAEAGINHNGDLDAAKALARAAKLSGAGIVKFQHHITDEEMLRGGPTAGYVGEPFDKLMDRCSLSQGQLAELKGFCDEMGIVFLATPFSFEAATQLQRLGVAGFKTGSGELTNTPLLEYIASFQKPMIVSTGMSTWDEVDRAYVKLAGAVPLVLLHCTSTYPTDYKDVRLLAITEMLNRYDCPIGISDHSQGIATALGAVALGACFVEKHFTLDRSWPGPDQAASLEPLDLARLVKEARLVWEARGPRMGVLPEELPVLAMARHSVVTTQRIGVGEEFTTENVTAKRPGTGIPAARLSEVLGQVAARDVEGGTLLEEDDVSHEWGLDYGVIPE